MQQQTITLIVGVSGILGTLGGIALGHWLSRSRAREEWLRDRQLEELRELIVALSESMREELKTYAGAVLDPKMQIARVEANARTFQTIQSRLFTAIFVGRTRIEERWAVATRDHQETLDVAKLALVFGELRSSIVSEAFKATGLNKRT